MITLKEEMGGQRKVTLRKDGRKWVVQIDGRYDYFLDTLATGSSDDLIIDLDTWTSADNLRAVVKEAQTVVDCVTHLQEYGVKIS